MCCIQTPSYLGDGKAEETQIEKSIRAPVLSRNAHALLHPVDMNFSDELLAGDSSLETKLELRSDPSP